MNTVLIPLVATAAAGALTWFFCIRPMSRQKRNNGRAGAACCSAPGRTVEQEIRAAREELVKLQAAGATPAGENPPSPRHES